MMVGLPTTTSPNRGQPTIEVKICGVRTIEAAKACGGANWVGLNRVPGINRFVTDEAMGPIVAALTAARPILVVRNATLEAVLAQVSRFGVHAVQLHGDEQPEMGAALRKQGVFVAKALHAGHLADTDLVRAWAAHADRFVLDGRDAGSGKTWAWADLRLVGGALAGVPVWLAGGLHPDNVGGAVAQVRPAGVDVASGVERDGTQATDLIERFIESANDALKEL
ncbi:MAG: phosphoribosylanthranilate isomerase [Myxococcales bacterium]|nr:phosphoribosylanthranilate isomerase [Myxococcales bacterium]